MLPSVSSLANQLSALPPTLSSNTAATNFINVVANFINQVQAGPTGTPGILTYNHPPGVSGIQALQPVNDNSWISNFANAVHSGVTSGTLTPGTVTDPAWTFSTVDTATPVITNFGAALSVLISGLSSVTSSNNPPVPLAQALHDYASTFIFQCTGQVTNPSPPPASFPLTLTFNAE